MVETTGPHQGAKVALFLGDRLVSILRDDRPDIPFPNHWDLPGGGREGAETTFETVARELFEELGLRLRPAQVLWENAFQSSTDATKWNAFFVARMPASAVDDIVFGDEGQRWALYSLAEFVALPDVAPNYDNRLKLWTAQTGGLNGDDERAVT